METVSALLAMQVWLARQIEAESVRLKSPQKNNRTDTYELVAPAVHVAYLPPKTQLAPDGSVRIPCLLVGTPDVEDDGENSRLDLRIAAAVYDPGTQKADSAGLGIQLLPNLDGYVTLLNLLDRVKRWVRRNDGIADAFQLESPIRLSADEDQPWPYWYGAVMFTVSQQADPTTRYAKLIN